MKILRSKFFIAGMVFALLLVVGMLLTFRLPPLPAGITAVGIIGATGILLRVGIDTAGVVRRVERSAIRLQENELSALAANASRVRGVERKVVALSPVLAKVSSDVEALTSSISVSDRKISDVESGLADVARQLHVLSDLDRRSRVNFGRIHSVQQELLLVKAKLVSLEEEFRVHKLHLEPLVAAGPSLSALDQSTLAMGDQLGRGFTNVVVALDTLVSEVQGTSAESAAFHAGNLALRAEAEEAAELEAILRWQTSTRSVLAGLDLMPALVGIGHYFVLPEEVRELCRRKVASEASTVVVSGLSESAMFLAAKLPSPVQKLVVICESVGEQELANDLFRVLLGGRPVEALLRHELEADADQARDLIR